MLRNVRKSDERPLWLPEIYYKELCVYWKSPEFLKLSQSGKKNRVEGMGGQGAGKSTCGSVSILEHEERLRAQLGDKFTVYDLYKRGHQIQTGQKKGEWADSRAQKFSEAFESLKEKATQQSNETGQPAPDDVSLMLQVEGLKKGHAYGLGSMSQRLRGASTSVGGSIEMPLSSIQVASLTKTIEKKIKGKFDKKLKKIIEMQKQILELSNVRVPVDF